MNEMEVSTIGERIKTLRKKRGYNQKDLANLLGKSLRTIQKYESGEIEVSIAMVNELAKVLDTTPIFSDTRQGISNLTVSLMLWNACSNWKKSADCTFP